MSRPRISVSRWNVLGIVAITWAACCGTDSTVTGKGPLVMVRKSAVFVLKYENVMAGISVTLSGQDLVLGPVKIGQIETRAPSDFGPGITNEFIFSRLDIGKQHIESLVENLHQL